MPETKHVESGFTAVTPQIVGPGVPSSGSDIGLNRKNYRGNECTYIQVRSYYRIIFE
jgi:hypothetical protein